jgi:hypothetical protein
MAWAAGNRHQRDAAVVPVLCSNEVGHILVGREVWCFGEVDWFVVQLSDGRPV